MPRADGELPKTSALHRLNDWMRRAGVERFSFVNAYQEPGPYRRDGEPFALACAFVSLGHAIVHDERLVVVALGNHASRMLDGILSHVKWPHPSGLNRQINDPRNVTRAIGRLRRALCT